MKKRVVSLLLCLIMALSLIPTTAFAVGTSSQDDGISLTSIVKPDGQSYYTYEFYLSSDSSEPYSTQIVKEGEKLYQPETPTTPEGKVFTGWYDEAGNPFTGFGKVDEITKSDTIKLTARIEDGYYVFFKKTDGTVIDTITGKTNDKVTFDSVSFPVNANQAITGWYTDKDCTSGKQVESVTIKDSNITLYAKVEEGHWITFDSDGGSYVEPKFFATSKYTEKPNDPAKPGYAFAGWNTEDGTAYTFGNLLAANITLKAKWTAKDSVKYTVIHWQENANDTGYSLKETETKTGTVGAQTNAAAKDTKRVEAYNGFTAQTIVQKPIAGDDSTIVNVYYKRNEYVINFYSSNNPSYSCGKKEHEHRWKCYNWKGQLTCGKEEHRHTNDCLKPTHQITAKYGAYIRDQWPGGGWYVSPNSSTAQTSIDVMPLGGTNFYGEQDGSYTQTAKYYTEVLPGDEANGTRKNDGRYYYNEPKYTDTTNSDGMLKVTAEDRYDITGFKLNDSLSTSIGAKYNGAEFYYTRNSHDIVFFSGGQKVNTVSKKYEESIADVNYKPTTHPAGKEGYTFVGWYDNDLCEGEKYVFAGKTMPDQNITLYAKWEEPVHTVTVYDSNRTTVLATLKKAHKSTIDMNKEMPNYTLPKGYKFLGWVLLEDGTPFNFNTEITRNYNLYAKIGSMATYTVTYKANNGSDDTVVDPLKYAMGAYASVKANSFNAPSGQVFLGWSTTASGSVAYYANSKLEITGNMELYAIWGDKDSTVTLTYNANYGEKPATNTIYSIKNNAKVTLKQFTELFPARDGYRFTGWNTQADGSGTSFAAGSNARVDVDNDGDNVLYAQWKRQTGTLIINKVVEGLTGTSAPTEFNFTVTGPNNYSKDVTVSANGSLPLTGLPVGEYTVKEKPTDIPGYTLNTTYKTDAATAEPTTEKATVTVTANTDATVTVTNTYTKDTTSVTVTKMWDYKGVVDEKDRPTEITVQLLANGTKIKTATLYTTNEWTHTWDKLPTYDENGAIEYTVVEKDVPAGFTDTVIKDATADHPTFIITNAANVSKDAEVTPASLTVIKTDAKDGSLLKGAKFVLIAEDKSEVTMPTGKDGKAVFTGLTKGTYTLKEVTAPEGYQATDKTWTITVSDDAQTAGYVLKDGKFVKTVTCKVDDVENVVSNGTITITNAKKVTPPPAEYTLSVDIQKNIELKRSSSRKPGKASFTFEAYLVDEKGNETILDTVTIDTKGTKSADGTLTFTLTEDDLSVTGHGTVYVREVKGSTRGWTYDDTVYALGVELTTDGKLNIISVDTKRIDKPATLEFTNVYYKRSTTTGGGDKPIQSVKTGDMGIAMYAMTSLLSLGGAALVIKKRKEEK